MGGIGKPWCGLNRDCCDLGVVRADAVRPRQCETSLPPSEKRAILVSHPAFGYFCREFGCEQISVEHEGKDPLPRDLEYILQHAKDENAKIVLLLPQHSNKGAILIAKELGIPTKMIDPYSADYIESILSLAKTLSNPEGKSNDTICH